MQVRIFQNGPIDWLSLSDAAEVLGVHPGTLRRWADKGEITCSRTPGGHRRFSGDIINNFIESHMNTHPVSVGHETIIEGIVTRTHHEVQIEDPKSQKWYSAFNANDRELHKDKSRYLLSLILQYVLRIQGRGPLLKQVAEIGWDFGSDARKHGLSLVEMVKAFFFFRETLLKAMRPGFVSRGQYDLKDIHIHRSLREILDHIFFAAIEGYEKMMVHRKEEEMKA